MSTGYRPEIVQSAFIDLIGARLNRFWSLTTPRVRLIARQTLNNELIALQFETNQAFRRQTFVTANDWDGGQYISLTVPLNGIHHQRHYSLVGLSQQPSALQKAIANASSFDNSQDGHTNSNIKNRVNKNILTIAIKPQGLVSNHLTEHVKIGTVFDASTPSGGFTLAHAHSKINLENNNPTQPTLFSLLFVAGGSGITPMLGLITQALEQHHQVTLLYYHRSPRAHTPFLSYWQYLAATYSTFNYHIVSTAQPETYLADSRYLTTKGLLTLQLPLTNTIIFACGSPSLLQSLYQAASDIKLSNKATLLDNIIVENFGTAHISAQDSMLDSEEIKPQTVVLRGRQQQFITDTTLLLGAEAAGIRLPYGCRQGICQLCRCQKLSGVVKNIQTGKLSTSGYESIQTCINVPMSDIVIES